MPPSLFLPILLSPMVKDFTRPHPILERLISPLPCYCTSPTQNTTWSNIYISSPSSRLSPLHLPAGLRWTWKQRFMEHSWLAIKENRCVLRRYSPDITLCHSRQPALRRAASSPLSSWQLPETRLPGLLLRTARGLEATWACSSAMTLGHQNGILGMRYGR